MAAPARRPSEDIVVSDLSFHLDLSSGSPVLYLLAARVVLPQAAFRTIVQQAARARGVSLEASLTDRGFRVRVPMGPLKVSAEFAPRITSAGIVTLQPVGGVPGWMIGLGGRLMRGVSGIEIRSNGEIEVQLQEMLPASVRLSGRITSLEPSPTQMTVTVTP